MNSGKGKPLWRFEWYIVVIFAALAAVVVLAIFTNILKKTEPVQIPVSDYQEWCLPFGIFYFTIHLAATSSILRISLQQSGAL